MDPAATLALVEQHLQAGRLDDARAALRDFWTWRRRGGFQPPGGDALARRLDRDGSGVPVGGRRRPRVGRRAAATRRRGNLKKADVKVGGRYIALVSGRLATIQITGPAPYGKGWVGRNLTTGREIRVRTAARLRAAAGGQD